MAVHRDMAERWGRLQKGLRVLMASNRELELLPEEAEDRTEAWLWAAVHRVFAAPLSALMYHNEEASGVEKKRHA